MENAMMKRSALGWVLVLASCVHEADVKVDARAIHVEGAGSYTTELLPGERGPSNRQGAAVKPKTTGEFRGPPSSNDWWSSLIWQFDGDAHSRPRFPHPLAMKAEAEGLSIGYPTQPVIAPRDYRFPYARDLRIGVASLHAPDTRVESWSDWAVTAAWIDGERALRATFGHGLPFVYARTAGGDARVELETDAGDPSTWGAKDEVIAVTVHGHHYGLFAPKGATWRRDGAALVSSLAGKGFFSVAVLPDATPETLATFRKHAYAFVTDTQVTWRFEPQSARVVSRFEVKTALAQEGEDDKPLLALYPHQWKNTKAAVLPASYVSPRGAMRIVEASAFDVERPFHGVLPVLPDAGKYDRDALDGLVRDAAGESDLFPVGLEGKKDSYWTGKSLGKVSSLVWLADQLGDTKTRTRLVGALEKELDDWFDGRPPNRFYYDASWRTLIGLPAGYQSGTEMNDHHFHYGYFVWAAATIAAHDPAWAQSEKWGAVVKLLVKDVANWERSDERFPRLRYFDPYAGHSWASGPAMFDRGNNEESSSEDVNFAAGLVLWGAITGDDTLRDLGAFLYETTVSAIEQYWLDVDHDVFPKGFRHPVAGIVWGDGVKYDTWWDRNPIYVHGINVLPVTGASLYLGRRPEVVRERYEHLLRENRGPVQQWRDVLWMYEALDDGAKAEAAMADDHHFEPEFGNTWATTSHWIRNLHALGHVDTSVKANTTSYGVFKGAEGRTYAAYNPAATPVTVTFTDGATLDVPPRSMRHVTRASK
jgi:endoglucanase Acf2